MTQSNNEAPAFDRAAQKKSHLGTIHYEIRMLRYSLESLLSRGPDYEPSQERYVYLEAYLLHYRNIVNFLSGSGGSAGDLTIKAPHLWAEGAYSGDVLKEISRVAKPVYTAHSGNISTFLAHCTVERHDRVQQWHPRRMYEELVPALDLFEKTFPRNTAVQAETVLLGRESYSTATFTQHPLLYPTREKS